MWLEKRTVSHYQYAKAYLIKRFVENFNWNRTFANFCANEQVSIPTNTKSVLWVTLQQLKKFCSMTEI